MKKIAFLFPGQGSQYVGMGRKLCEMFTAADQTFEEANDALGFDLKKLCFEGGMEELTKTENTQPAILTTSVAAYRVYMQEIAARPDYMAGHSLGEFSALCCAGAMEFSDAVKIVRQRGKFMQEAVPAGVGSMAAISGADKSAIKEECSRNTANGKFAVVSNYNSPEQIVISGHAEAVRAACESLKAKGARATPLKVSAPFHSPLMQPAADRLKEELAKYTYSEMKYPVISNVTALPYPDSDKIIEYLSLQIVKPVRWQESTAYILEQGVELAVEMGPQAVLKNLMKKNAPGIKVLSYETEEDIKALKRELSAAVQPYADDIKNGLALITKCIAIAVCTKNSNWNEDEYIKGVVEPYRKIQTMKAELEKDNKQPSIEQMRDALHMLKSVFVTKKTPHEEQIERFNQVFDGTGTVQLFTDFTI